MFDHELSRSASPHSSLTPWLTTIWWAPLQTVMLEENSRGFTSYPNYNCIFFVSSAIICQLIWLGTHLTLPPLNPNISFLFLHVSSKWIRESRADAGLQSSSLIATCKTIPSRMKRCLEHRRYAFKWIRLEMRTRNEKTRSWQKNIIFKINLGFLLF